MSFRWALTAAPAGSAATLDNPFEIRPQFTADLPGTYVVQLIVEDATRPNLPDTIVITTGNSALVAEAGFDQTVAPGATVQLDGSGSFDADSDALGFRWSLTLPGQTRRKLLLQDIADVVARGRAYHEARAKGRRRVRNAPRSTKVVGFMEMQAVRAAEKRAKRRTTNSTIERPGQ